MTFIEERNVLDFEEGSFDDAWLIAIGVSKFDSLPLGKITEVDKSRLLELRVFDEKREIKRVRGSLGEKFQERDTQSGEFKFDKSRTEKQYLDIDEKKSNGEIVWATGGGTYKRQDPAHDCVEVEHFYKADKKGFYYPFDFRLVKFFKEGGKQK